MWPCIHGGHLWVDKFVVIIPFPEKWCCTTSKCVYGGTIFPLKMSLMNVGLLFHERVNWITFFFFIWSKSVHFFFLIFFLYNLLKSVYFFFFCRFIKICACILKREWWFFSLHCIIISWILNSILSCPFLSC